MIWSQIRSKSKATEFKNCIDRKSRQGNIKHNYSTFLCVGCLCLWLDWIYLFHKTGDVLWRWLVYYIRDTRNSDCLWWRFLNVALTICCILSCYIHVVGIYSNLDVIHLPHIYTWIHTLLSINQYRSNIWMCDILLLPLFDVSLSFNVRHPNLSM